LHDRGCAPSPGRAFELQLSNDDGTPTAWCALIGIVAPSLVVLLIIALAIFRY